MPTFSHHIHPLHSHLMLTHPFLFSKFSLHSSFILMHVFMVCLLFTNLFIHGVDICSSFFVCSLIYLLYLLIREFEQFVSSVSARPSMCVVKRGWPADGTTWPCRRAKSGHRGALGSHPGRRRRQRQDGRRQRVVLVEGRELHTEGNVHQPSRPEPLLPAFPDFIVAWLC